MEMTCKECGAHTTGLNHHQLILREDGYWCCDCVRLDHFLDRLIGVLIYYLQDWKGTGKEEKNQGN